MLSTHCLLIMQSCVLKFNCLIVFDLEVITTCNKTTEANFTCPPDHQMSKILQAKSKKTQISLHGAKYLLHAIRPAFFSCADTVSIISTIDAGLLHLCYLFSRYLRISV